MAYKLDGQDINGKSSAVAFANHATSCEVSRGGAARRGAELGAAKVRAKLELPPTMDHDDNVSRELVDSTGRDLEQILQHLPRVLAELRPRPLRPAPPALEARAQRGNFDRAADRAHVDLLELSARDVVLVVDHVVDGVDRT